MTYASSFAYETNEIPRLVDVKGSIIRCGCSPLNYAAAGHFRQFVQKILIRLKRITSLKANERQQFSGRMPSAFRPVLGFVRIAVACWNWTRTATAIKRIVDKVGFNWQTKLKEENN